jgi:hypothetical protein
MSAEARSPKSGAPWTDAEERKLSRLLTTGLARSEIAARMGRSEVAIAGKIGELKRRAAGQARRYAVRHDSPLPRLS